MPGERICSFFAVCVYGQVCIILCLGSYLLTFLRYYAVDFAVNKTAVTILQLKLLLREDTQWGQARLAVQGIALFLLGILCK